MGSDAFCIEKDFIEIGALFYIPEINAPYLQFNEGGPPRVEPSLVGRETVMDSTADEVITGTYPVTPITSLCEPNPGVRLFSRSR